MSDAKLSPPAQPTFRELFAPKLLTILSEGYDFSKFKADAIAGLTVAIVALPLSMAIAIACGAKPEAGLYTAIVSGFLISALGGSRFQIGGPAGAFIVLIATTISQFGYDGFLLATFMAGILLMLIGFMRLGAYIKYIPYPVTVGFTAGIGVIIFSSQITELLGLTLQGKEPAALLPKIQAIIAVLPSINPWAMMISMLTIAIIVGLKRFRPNWPSLLIAIAVAAAVTHLFALDIRLDVRTIKSAFGGVPGTLPLPALPNFSLDLAERVFPAAIAIALLGGIESLLSAVVADAMTGRRHRSNCELVAQGVANIAASLFGGICATGTIARTATNVRAGAIGPISGMLHAVFLLCFILIAAPLASSIPLAALSGILAIVSFNMIDTKEFISTFKRSRGETAVLLTTFLLTVFRDLTEGIAVGVVMGSLLFMHKMAQLVTVEGGSELLMDDIADVPRAHTTASEVQGDQDVLIYRISGPLFFGAATTVATALENIGRLPPAVVLDFSAVPLADSSAVQSLRTFVNRVSQHGGAVYVAGASPMVRRILVKGGLPVAPTHYHVDADTARDFAHAEIAARQTAAHNPAE